MKSHFRAAGIAAAILFLLSIPAAVFAQTQSQLPAQSPPPIGTPLVREGDFAVRLAPALGISTTNDEIEAESRLGEIGISPRNGWIADYPVTPDVLGELQAGVAAAADGGRLLISRADALKRLDETTAQAGLPVVPYAGQSAQAPPAQAANYPNPTIINNYYYSSGPPIVTYYNPPPDFYYLYAWVPYPFWWYDFWFPGFFVLHDFHRVVVIHGRPVHVSNHFNDVRAHRVLRIDPDARFRGRTFAGIGAPRSKNFISAGKGSERRVFNAPRGRFDGGGRTAAPAVRSGAAAPAARSGTAAPAVRSRAATPPPRSGVEAPVTRSAPESGGRSAERMGSPERGGAPGGVREGGRGGPGEARGEGGGRGGGGGRGR